MIKLSRHSDWRPDWTIIRSLFRFGLPTGARIADARLDREYVRRLGL